MNDPSRRARAPASRGSRAGDRRRRYALPTLFAVTMVGLAALGVAIAVAMTPRGPAQLALHMRPALRLTTAACIGQLTPYGFSTSGASRLCSFGAARNWYRALLVNRGDGAYPLCHAKGLDAQGKIGGGIAGLYAHAHRSVTFTWCLPVVSRPITSYTASCTVNDNPPI